ncbi:hypothetical protein AB4422_17290 [Vibrio splendidus]
MDIYALIEKWGLDRESHTFKRFSRSEISEIANEIMGLYNNSLPKALGRKHLSIHDSINLSEANNPVSTLAVPLLFSKQIWLPDPLYSVLAPNTKSIWSRLPESGPMNIMGQPGPYLPWDNYWTTRTSERVSYLDSVVPTLVKRLIELKPLVKSGYIILYPWEIMVGENLDSIKKAVVELSNETDILDKVRHKYKQKEYSIGARLGPIGFEVARHPPQGLKARDSMWLGDPSSVLYGGMLNTLLTSSLSADFVNTLKGDRLVHDFIRSGGEYNPVLQNGVQISLPNLSNALWPEIVAVKQDSELVDKLSSALDGARNLPCSDAELLICDELKLLESQFKNDLSISKLVGSPVAELSVATMAGFTGGLFSGGNPTVALASSGIASVSSFLLKLANTHQSPERLATKKRKDIICSISSAM